MDPNLLFWKSNGQSFFSRIKIWFDLLDPMLLISSDNEIQKARSVFKGDKHEEAPATVSLSSVHADTGEVLPIVFRPGAMLPLASPIIYAALTPHSTVKSALLSHFLLQSYFTGFNHANRNASVKLGPEGTLKQMLLNFGTVSYATCAGAVPQILVYQLQVSSPSVLNICRRVLPVPLAALLAYFNLTTVRSEESENGIQVFDFEGNAVGLSKAAGHKAVRETALSRAALLGATAAASNLLLALLQRSRLFQRRSLLLAPLRPLSVVLTFGLTVPASFSLFPQLGTIKRENLEEELQAAASDGHLFYHRGL